ncbi:MAG: S-methyl-5-thioribose-1-phosphate isomerase, partial [Desulfovibrio sp.]|nr:S-methyl-5-thioribose-1-phosphate isomerase [Desulfovibrio sp.]
VIHAIQQMVVRGAPAIGVCAAYACCMAAQEAQGDTKKLNLLLDAIAQARPTAVNLRWAVERMRSIQNTTGTEGFVAEASRIQAEDINNCKAMGQYGQSLIPENATILTHCNAGALATAGYGTALGVIRAAHECGKNISVICNETRPFLQGARLSAWELHQDGIKTTVACDNSCALLMQKKMIQCCIVGADRIAANGDTANKIGTFGVAILAKHFHIPFYVAAPISTIDSTMPDGTHIPIEVRPQEEVRTILSQTIVPEGVAVYNYAFDVTDASLITAIITEVGVLYPPFTASIAHACQEKQ